MDIKCRFEMDGTIVDNGFIDRFMASANGEYVKVYLYLLRHRHEELQLGKIADALNHTEADVRRALLYWEKIGALNLGGSREEAGGRRGDVSRAEEAAQAAKNQETASVIQGSVRISDYQQGGCQPSGYHQLAGERQESAASRRAESRLQAGEHWQAALGTAASRAVYSQEQVNRLADNEDFTQLLYIAQKYMNKVFTPRECEVFAYLYDGLHLSVELLEYLVEHCVQGGHTSIRYIETVALSWHEKGLRTVEQAKAYASGFTKDSFAVMRAFGLTDRKPGDTELDMIRRWFGEYGFARDVVLEACNRTLEATHSPSFRYADKILTEWKKAGVRNLGDIGALDQRHHGQKAVQGSQASRKPANQFHNFEQRNTDYDSMVLDHVKSWIGES